MRLLAAVLLSAVAASAAIEGTVTNATTGKPQPDATVTLIRLREGMNSAGSVKSNAAGKFRLDLDLEAGAPHLLQALHQGVTYNRMLSPGASASGIALEVFDASQQPGDAKVTQHMILLEPSGGELKVNESVIFANSGKTTFNAPDGTLKFYAPPAVKGPVRVIVQGPQGMPVQRPPEPAKAPNTYSVQYPIRPGETRIDLQYSMPSTDPGKFESKILHGGGPVRIIAPKGVKLEGAGLTDLGPEPRTQANIYNLATREYSLVVRGEGSLRQAAEAAGISESEDSTPKVEEARPRIYRRLPWILALTLTMLTIGFILLYRSDAPGPLKTGKRG